ncbi:hypothetical protein PNEG_03591 [Pneumocystis murina B123]|uniref:Cytochrome P450 n=1 Tax=Pneumocystis murina (strain B123) TaxID=1069680 RepID=M7PCF6_PNEMU|nr:hypothetical protein PNEG_03591 [Pneumocystis murina B123]EMR08154.1 hypothetical protein PNEG_03591 [Pneumocystis murina B123]
MLSDDVYNVSTKVISIIVSPWIIILISSMFIFSLYVFYYRPRLYYSYPSYPSSPAIYFLPPWKRIRDFNRNPIQYLLTAVSKTPHSGIIWIDVVKPYTCLSIILSLEPFMGSQFLSIGESVLSWDAALRRNWSHIFKDSKDLNNMDSFGRHSRFSKASNFCLSQAFSPCRTNIGGYYYSCIASETLVALSQNTSDSVDLKGFIDNIVIRALISIFFGSYESDYEHILRLTCTIHKSLEKSHSYDSNALKAKNEFVKVISRLLVKRTNDPETYSNGSDYVQWLLTYRSESELSIDSTMFHASLFDFSDNNDINIENQKSQSFSKILKVDIPIHLLVSLLSTWIICTNTILWVIVNQYRISEKEVPFDPNPLFLVRRAQKDILIGKFLVPKNTYLSVCSSVSSLSSFFMNRYVSQRFSVNSSEIDLRCQSLDKLKMINSINQSQGNISLFSQNNGDSVPESSSSSTNFFQSRETTISNSASESNLSVSNLRYISAPLKYHQNFNRGIKNRIYPHQHLIRLIITTVLNHVASAVVIKDKITNEKLNVYYTARHLWFPIPSRPIFVSILPATFVTSDINQKHDTFFSK